MATSAIVFNDDEKSATSKGFSVDLFKHKTYALQYQCIICKQICKNPVELSCGDDYDYDYHSIGPNNDKANNHDVLYCESCLSFNLSANNNQCPINPKHLKTNYNIARNIRKQINNLSVYCHNKLLTNIEGDNNNTCPWEGKLCKLNSHLKTCKYNSKGHCDICNTSCIENTINEHNAHNIIKHITLLHKQSLDNHNDHDLSEINDNIVQVNDDFAIKVEEQINDLTATNNKLKQDIKTMKKKFNNWKIAYNIENSKKEIKLKRLLDKHNDSIALLQKQNKQLHQRIDSQITLTEKFDAKHIKKLQSEIEKLKKLVQSSASLNSTARAKIPKKKDSKVSKLSKSIKSKHSVSQLSLRGAKSATVKKVKVKSNINKKKRKKGKGKNKADNKPDKLTDTDIDSPEPTPPTQPVFKKAGKSVPFPKLPAKIPPLKRSSSMKYFHPDGPEWYHPKGIHYEMYHPQKSVEVWVSKTQGNQSKLHRYPCCGSAKEGPLYLKRSSSNKNVDEALFVVGTEEDMPDKWHADMHLGCEKNRRKNKNNMSYYECCEKGIMNVGCKQRYKCCGEKYKVDNKSDGCKVGWSC